MAILTNFIDDDVLLFCDECGEEVVIKDGNKKSHAEFNRLYFEAGFSTKKVDGVVYNLCRKHDPLQEDL